MTDGRLSIDAATDLGTLDDARDPRDERRLLRTYSEHPMFVPFAGGHLAAVLTVPDTDPRGLVLLLQGLGASRSHKNRVWTRLARTMAGRGIASVRMDYPDLGDSTGKLRADLDDPPVDEAEAIAGVAMEVSGTDRFGVVGNCMGLRAGFALANRNDACITVASILLGSAKPLLRGQGFSASGRAVKRATTRLPKLARTVRRFMPDTHLEQHLRLLPDVESVLRTRGGYFLFFGRPEATGRFEQGLHHLLVDGERTASTRIGFRSVAAPGTAGFRIPVDLQPILIESISGWMDGVFPPGA